VTKLGVEVLVNVPIATTSDKASTLERVQRLKDSKGHVFYINMFDTQAKTVLLAAYDLGIVGPDYGMSCSTDSYSCNTILMFLKQI
jgi:hypothetical protein